MSQLVAVVWYYTSGVQVCSCSAILCGTVVLGLLLFGSKLSPLVLHLRHVCCCSDRNHLLFSGAKLEKVEENDKNKKAIWYCPESCVSPECIIFITIY